MATKSTSNNQAVNEALADSVHELGLASGGNANEVVENFAANARGVNDPRARAALIVPVIQNFSNKIAEMYFYDRQGAYRGAFKTVLDNMYDKDLVYGYGREYALTNFVPVVDYDQNQFVPNEITTPLNTVSQINIDQPKKTRLTITPELYLPAVNNGANLDRLVASLRTTLSASWDTYLDNTLIENWILAQANSATATTINNDGTLTAPTNTVGKITDTTSQNTKQCIMQIEWLIKKMTTVSTNFFNMGGTDSNSFFVSDDADIKILCTNKFYNNVKYGMSLGLFKPELLNNFFNRLVPLPDHKVILPTTTNTSASMGAFTNMINDNTLIIVNDRNSFKFGKQFKNESSQYYQENMAIQIVLQYIPYFGYLKNGQMFVYNCDNLNVLPANPMENA